MRNNIGIKDKIIRIVVALILLISIYNIKVSSTLSIMFFLLAMVLIVTCINGSCPVYKALGITTKRNLNQKAKNYEKNKMH